MNHERKTKLNKEMDRAKIGLLQVKGSAFLSTVLFSLKFSWDETIPTACTNGLNLKFSPDFFEKLTKEERIFVLAHEAWHVAFMHMSRLTKEREENFYVWNMATDHYINNMLIKAGYKMVEGGLADPKYADQSVWSSDKIFDDLMKDPENKDKGNEGFDMSISDLSEEEKESISRKIEDVIIKASVQAKMANQYSSIPGEISTRLDELLNPKLPWNVILQKYMSAYAKEDYSYRRPNRRFLGGNVIMPSLYSNSLGHIACAVDTSCSVSDEQFNAFRTEMNTIKTKLNPELMTIVDFDTQIHKVYELKKQDRVDTIQFHGRGGTDLHCVFDHYNEPNNKPKVLIIFSDLECSEITEAPDYDVIFIKLDGYGFNPTFGNTIDYDM